MLRIETQPAIDIRYPEEHIGGKLAPVSQKTKLFRLEACLPLAITETVARNPDKETFSVLVAPCGNGAEPYSLAGYNFKYEFAGRLAMCCVDISPQAIQEGITGHYFIPHSEHDDEDDRRELETDLQSFGFLTDFDSTYLLPDKKGKIKPHYMVDAAPLKARNQVKFIEHDLRDVLPGDAVAGSYFDLILINNLLDHLPSSEATRVMRNTVKYLSRDGVVSVGMVAEQSKLMGVNEGQNLYDAPSYLEWLTYIEGWLEAEFGLKAVLRVKDVSRAPILFARNQIT
jgi:chemotaxis methyl-accepting protein methylase